MAAIFSTPALDATEIDVIERVNAARAALRARIGEHEPRRWLGGLRRMAFARNVQGSNSIEGYVATLDDTLLAIDGEDPLSADVETKLAVTGYRDAMTYVLQIADDPSLRIDAGLLKALHFMMLKHEIAKSPGSWRPGPIFVHDEAAQRVVYEGPDFELVPDLIDELASTITHDDNDVIVRAAMAHLNFVMIHPFRDGNGRMARCLQTLVLTRDGLTNSIFASIEEYLGRNTPAYYRVLAEVGQGTWSPDNDARPWVRFCLSAHLHQAQTMLRRVDETEQLWIACETLAREHRLPERTVAALLDAARGIRIRRPSYMRLAEIGSAETISELTASRDLKDMVTAGLLSPHGATRGRHYEATERLTAQWKSIQSARSNDAFRDPFHDDSRT